MPDCVFCKIRDGQIPSAKVYEDTKTMAFMDINPLTRGHCLVATKQHAANIYEAEVEDLKAVMATAKKVPHFHLHLIPRWTGDGKGFDWKLVPGSREDIMSVADRIRSTFA